MAKTIRFTVTAADIENGERMDCCSCPIALAVKRRFPAQGETFVGYGGIYIDDTKIAALPREASDFIREFDTAASRVSPFSFEAEIL